MSRGERLVYYVETRLPNLKLTVHHATLRSHAKAFITRQKEEIWLSPMTKAPTPTEMSRGQSDNTNNATKTFD